MKRPLLALFLLVSSLQATPARADFFGGDLPLLAGILTNAIQQLSQLANLLNTGRNTLGLMQDINRGIFDAVTLLNTLGPNQGAGLYGDLKDRDAALKRVQELYGTPTQSNDTTVQNYSDTSVADALALHGSVYEYSDRMDGVGTGFQTSANSASPGRSAKLTTQALGVLVNLMNESLRTQATELKLQAQSLAAENKKDKDMAKHMSAETEGLKKAMQSDPADFSTPRF